MKKSICLILSILMVLSVSIPILADPDADRIHGLAKNRKIVERIAGGDDFLVGVDVWENGNGDSDENVDITPRWSSGGLDHTHQYLTARALQILRADKGDKAANLLTLYAGALLSNSDWPDTSENDGGLFTSHFYNPYTGKTFLGTTTALTRFLTHANNAKKYYAKNKSLAMQELGRSLHYLADINEPHHAALLIAIFSTHSEYESWVDFSRTEYEVTTSGLYSSIPINAKRNYASYCTELFRMAAFNAYDQADEANSSDMVQWDASAADSMAFAQESMAAYLYNFLYAVGAVR